MSDPTISVVIPAYNAATTIGRAIDSVVAQTVPASEIIVVDDGSTDRSVDVIRRYGSAVKLIQQPNSQTSAARNRGIDAASAEFVAFLDADDYWEPEKLARQLAVLRQYPNIDVVAARFYSQPPSADQDSGQSAPRSLPALRGRNRYDRPLRYSGSAAFRLGTMMWTGTVLVRRSALAENRFVSGLEPAEDRDLWIRLAARHTVLLLSAPLATAVLEADGISRRDIANDCTRMLEVIARNKRLLALPSRLLWRSYIHYRWAAIEPSPATSLPLLAKSFLAWPIPLAGMPTMKPLGRLKRLVFLIKQIVRRSAQPQGASS